MSKIRTSDGQVLQSTNKRTVQSDICKRGTSGGKMLSDNHRSGYRFAIKELSPRKNVTSILGLTEKESSRGRGGFKTKKIAKRT
jgi:hypothetical protein